jgi:hydrogenase maturation factor
MHDPTEGGIVTALWELADASGCEIEVDLFGDESPWLPDGEALCRAFHLDPAGAIASGALLLTVEPDRLEQLLDIYHRARMPVYRLGRVGSGNPAVRDRQRGELLRPARDEIARLFE